MPHFTEPTALGGTEAEGKIWIKCLVGSGLGWTGFLSCTAISHAGSFVVVQTFVEIDKQSPFGAMKRNDSNYH